MMRINCREKISFMLKFKMAHYDNHSRKEAVSTPWTWAASLASLVVKAPVVFLGSSNQLTSCDTENDFIILKPDAWDPQLRGQWQGQVYLSLILLH